MTSRREQRVHVFVWIKRNQILNAFPETDELDRYPELGLDSEGDAALGRAVQFGQNQDRKSVV